MVADWKIIERSVVITAPEGQLQVLAHKPLLALGIVDAAWGDPKSISATVVAQHSFGDTYSITLTSERAVFMERIVDANRASPNRPARSAAAYCDLLTDDGVTACGVNPKYFAVADHPADRVAKHLLAHRMSDDTGFPMETVSVAQTIKDGPVSIQVTIKPAALQPPGGGESVPGLLAAFNFHLHLAAGGDAKRRCKEHIESATELESRAQDILAKACGVLFK